MTEISNVIRELRESRSLTRPDLAKYSKVSRTHIWAIERGRIAPSLATLERLSSALGVGLGQLFSRSNAELLLEDDFIRAVHPFLRCLNDQQKQHLVKAIQAAPRIR
jgi:transcriptional regulator with XRE-family HTH domain